MATTKTGAAVLLLLAVQLLTGVQVSLAAPAPRPSSPRASPPRSSPAPPPRSCLDIGSFDITTLLDSVGTLSCKVDLGKVLPQTLKALNGLPASTLKELPTLIPLVGTLDIKALAPLLPVISKIPAKQLQALVPVLQKLDINALAKLLPVLTSIPATTLQSLVGALGSIDTAKLQALVKVLGDVDAANLSSLMSLLNSIDPQKLEMLVPVLDQLQPGQLESIGQLLNQTEPSTLMRMISLFLRFGTRLAPMLERLSG